MSENGQQAEANRVQELQTEAGYLQAVRTARLMEVDAIERRLGIEPRTSELRARVKEQDREAKQA